MIEWEDRSGGQVSSFLLGFFFAVVVCLGVGGALFVLQNERQASEETLARESSEQARAEAKRAEEEAQMQRQLAEKALREARETVENPNN